MSEYIFNIGITFTAYLLYAGYIFVVLTIVQTLYKKYGDDIDYVSHHRRVNQIKSFKISVCVLLLLYGFITAMTSRTHTPKNETLDRSSSIQETQQMTYRESGVIRDLSPSPDGTSKERQERFSDIVNYKD